MLLLLVPLIPLGLFIPGFLLARYLRLGLERFAAFPLSLVILFHCVFWLGICSVPIRLWSVAPPLLAITAAMYWLQRRSSPPKSDGIFSGISGPEKLLLAGCVSVGVVLLIHSLREPLAGGDVWFRWDFLAHQMLETGRFNFYPPLTPADFRTYFFVDGIPPLVSFTNWWLYASAGQYLPAATAIFVTAQFGCTLAFTYGVASVLYSRTAGVIAAAVLASASLYLRSVILAQETGLTALGMAAMLYFLLGARDENRGGATAAAASAAALCALSREYGWMALICGVIVLLWKRRPASELNLFGGVTAALALPWYARNALLTGNPFYSLRFFGLPVNAVHDRILHFYTASLGIQNWTAATWSGLAAVLLFGAAVPILAGTLGFFPEFRRMGYFGVLTLLWTGVWLQAALYTTGGIDASLRVLSPVMVLLSITAGGLIATWNRMRPAAMLVIGLCMLATVLQVAIYPAYVPNTNPSQWAGLAFPPPAPPAEFQIAERLKQVFPQGKRVLSDSAYLHAALSTVGIEVVPVWSPEVKFLFDAPQQDNQKRLADLNIDRVVIYPKTLNMQFLVSASSFYATLPERWKPVAQIGDFMFVLGPNQ